MAIASVATSVASSPALLSTTQPAVSTGTNSPQSGLNSSPAVINEVKVPAGSGVFGTTQTDIQTAVNGINAAIENFQRLDWSKFVGATSDQIAKAKQWDTDRLLGAEGATIALATESGVTGVSFNFEKLDTGATSSGGAQPGSSTAPQVTQAPKGASVLPSTLADPTFASSLNPASVTPGTPSSATSAASAADVALSVLTAVAQQPDSSTTATSQKYDIYV